jgi:hypothetical protein
VGVGTLLRRRLLTHPVALVAVATSVLMSMVVVATLQLLSSAIADASVRTTLTDLVDADAKPLPVVVTGTYEPTGVDEGLWVDDPLGLAGVSRSDFTTYGPFVAAEGSFDRTFAGSSTATWRWLPSGAEVTTDELPAVRADVAQVIDALRHTAGILPDGAADPAGAVGGPPLRDARVSSGLPDLLDTSALVSSRVRVSLLTPTVLLVVLGTASLVVAAALLA